MNDNLTKRNGCLVFLWLLVAFLGGFSIALHWNPRRLSKTGNAELQKMSEVMSYIENFYVDSVNTDSIYGLAINAMLQGLDPHSSYATADENKTMMETLEGSFEGIGIQFNIMNDTLMVVSVISGGPSEKAGLMAGDRMIEVDGKSIIGIKNDQAFKKLRGKKGSKVKVGILRPGFKDKYTYEITRGVIPTYTVDVAYMMDSQTGYIKLNEFGSTTAKEFNNAIQKLKRQGMGNLIVDLRGNGGGFLDAAVSVCDEFFGNKQKIVSIEGSKVRPEIIYASRKGDFEQGKVVILIDDFSASASEIVAGAIQDNDRGTIYGVRSFGKGLVQEPIYFSDGSGIRLTVARYYTPSGRCIQKPYSEDYEMEIYERYATGEMFSADSIKIEDQTQYKTAGGRTVYGGGGIVPDVFVPVDTVGVTDFSVECNRLGLQIKYASEVLDSHAKVLGTVHDMAALDRVLDSLGLEQGFLAYTAKNKVVPKEGEWARSREFMLTQIRALVARYTPLGDEAFYPIYLKTDKLVLKAVENETADAGRD